MFLLAVSLGFLYINSRETWEKVGSACEEFVNNEGDVVGQYF